MSRVGARVDALVGRRDPADGSVDLQGWMPGPAGAAVVDLLGGRVQLGVDVAEPELLVSLRIDRLGDPAVDRLARIVLGPAAATALVDLGPEPDRFWERPPEERDHAWRRRRGTAPGGLGLLGRLGLALAEVSDDRLGDRAVAVGLVEAGATAIDLVRDFDPHPEALTLLRAGLSRWLDLPDDAFDDAGPVALAVLRRRRGAWRKRVHLVDPGLADALDARFAAIEARAEGPAAGRGWGPVHADAAVDLLDASVESLPAMAPAAAGAATPLSPVRRLDRAAAGPPPIEVAFEGRLAADGARLIRAERAGHHLTVHVGGTSDEAEGTVRPAWLRVFTGEPTPTLLALAPFDDGSPRWHTAVALVPTGVPTARLLVDVTTQPHEPWIAPEHRAIERASALGAAAARASRRDDLGTYDAWIEAAEAWADLGDERRADLAREQATSPTAADPLLVDVLS